MHSSQRGMPPGRRHTHAQEIKIWPFRGRGWSYIIDTYVVLLSMVILIRLYTAVHGTYLRVRCARTGVKVIYVSGSLSNVCLEHISLVISVPRTIIIITRVKSFPLQKHPWYVFPSAKGTHVRYWQRMMGRKGVTQHFSSSEHYASDICSRGNRYH